MNTPKQAQNDLTISSKTAERKSNEDLLHNKYVFVVTKKNLIQLARAATNPWIRFKPD